MRTKLTRVFALAAGLLLWSHAAQAHHGNSQYDFSKTVTISGVITEFEWSNPHCLVHIDTKTDGGGVQRWTLELPSTFTMTRKGWSKTSLKAGDQAEVETHPAKNGTSLGLSGTGSFLLKFVANGKALPSQ